LTEARQRDHLSTRLARVGSLSSLAAANRAANAEYFSDEAPLQGCDPASMNVHCGGLLTQLVISLSWVRTGLGYG